MLTLHIFLSSDELNFWRFHIMLMLTEMLKIMLYVLLLSEIISFHSQLGILCFNDLFLYIKDMVKL